MGSDDKKPELRKGAEALHRVRSPARHVDPHQTEDLIHELEVHQIELEMQNEELQRAQSRLGDALARYQDLFELAPVGYVTHRTNGTILKANLTAANLLGVDRLQLTHSSLQNYVSPESQDNLRRHLTAISSVSDRETCELEFLKEDGNRIFARIESTAQQLGEAQARECLTAVTDITELKHREEAIRKSQAQLRLFIEQAPISIAMLNREMRYIAVSRRWTKEYGRGHKNLTGLSHYEVHPDLREGWKQVHREALAGAFQTSDEELWIQNDGSRHWLRWAVQPWTDEEGDVGGIIISLEDITARKQAERELRQADRRKDEFLATLAHELRNPMAPIRNAVQLFRLKPPADPDLQAAGDIIDRQSQHLVRLIDDLLDVSRITQGRLELRPEPVALEAILEQAIEACQPNLDRAGHELVLSLPKDPIRLDADPVRLTQVFVNLLNNACKYTVDGGRIGLAAKRDGADAVVAVRDNGRGIPAEHLTSLFEIFSRAESEPDQARGGAGIGLWLARGLMELHGGTIEARSEGRGKGSEFIVRLPALTMTATPPGLEPDEGKTTEPVSGRRVLVVDDNRDIVDSMTLLLELSGHQVETAHDGPEAIEAAARYRPEVILLDIGMPGMDGYTVCRRIREQPWGKDIGIIALTGWGQDDDRIRSEEAGFDDHLVKPVDSSALLRLLEQA